MDVFLQVGESWWNATVSSLPFRSRRPTGERNAESSRCEGPASSGGVFQQHDGLSINVPKRRLRSCQEVDACNRGNDCRSYSYSVLWCVIGIEKGMNGISCWQNAPGNQFWQQVHPRKVVFSVATSQCEVLLTAYKLDLPRISSSDSDGSS